VKAGLISYALYMYHQAVNGLLHGFIFNQEPRIGSLPEFAVGLLVMAIAIVLAILSYVYMEKPIRQLGRHLRYLRGPQHTVAVDKSIPAGVAESAVPAR
jgi:peptidoglycan/LPS O-acetylase OafA/YrhL